MIHSFLFRKLAKLPLMNLAAVVMLVATAEQVQAATTYQYIGNNYTSITNSEPPVGMYTTAMSLSGSFTVLAPLDMASDGDISGLVTAYSFNDGRFALTESNSRILDFDVVVDALGNIGTWDILVDDVLGATIGDTVSSLGTVFTTSGSDSTFAGICPEAICDRTSPFAQVDTAVVFNPGTWSIVPIPIPAAVWLFGSALGFLGWLRQQRNCFK